MFTIRNDFYNFNDVDLFFKDVMKDTFEIVGTKIKYYNVSASFDIETSSFYNNDSKYATMYIWQFGINGINIIGRTWKEFQSLLLHLKHYFPCDSNLRFVIYVHNLSYEFQFFRNWLTYEKIFALEERQPIDILCDDEYAGIEFKCSYILSGYSLENLSKNLIRYKVDKKVGDLDYTKIRHSNTILTNKEMGYCINDIQVVMAFIQEKIEDGENISKIPLTKTGYVRKFCRKQFYNDNNNNKSNKYRKNRELIKSLVMSVYEYKLCKQCFQGGLTHANKFYIGKLLENVSSYDFTSSYPYVCLSEKFPMGQGVVLSNPNINKVEHYSKHHCVIFDVTLKNVEQSFIFENIIPFSKCIECVNPIINNGRVVSADLLRIIITETDYEYYKKFYNFEVIKVDSMIVYNKGYLPKDFILSILKLYSDKTTLKGVIGEEVNYMQGKSMLNACYGMIVTDILRDNIVYDENGWFKSSKNIDYEIDNYNNSKGRFLFYPWGIYVTSYARRNLLTGILECDKDYVYSDTDSIKVLNCENHAKYFENYNKNVLEKLTKMCNFHNISLDLVKPKTIKGIEKLIGVWDYEGIYTHFKTLGAKRYIIEHDNEIEITVAGLGKKAGKQYLESISKNNIDMFNNFTNNLYVPKNFTGKLTHTYVDKEFNINLTDYNNITYPVHEKSYIHLENCDYTMNLSLQFIDYLKGIKEEFL